MTIKTNGKRAASRMQKAEPAALGTPFGELGVSGLLRWSGYIDEEFHRDLKGDRALKVYKEMRDNSPTVQACLYAYEMLLRGITWRVEAPGESSEDLRAADLIESARNDMSHSWQDLMAEVLSMLTFGWSYHEIVYKRRQGQQREPGESSRYDDGLIGWRKMPIRSQDSRTRWEFQPDGGIAGMYQQAPPVYEERYIPITKAGLFRPNVHKNNPEGRSLLRGAYVAWYYLKRIQETEAIGIERDLNGLPVGFVPAEIMSGSRTGAQATTYNAVKDIVTNVRIDEQHGVVWPMAYDSGGNQLYDFKLLSGGGAAKINPNDAIGRYQRDIAMTVMADFLFLGRENVGSLSLGTVRRSMLSAAAGTIADQIADVFNRHLIPRLLGYNGIRLEKLPEIHHGDIESVDLTQLATMITSLTGAGARLFPDLDLENHFRTMLGWPEMTEDQAVEREDLATEQATARAEAQAELMRANEERQAGKEPVNAER